MILKKILSALLVLVSCLCLSACLQENGNSPDNSLAGPVIGHLKTNDKLITVRVGQDGTVYKVTSNEGVVLAVDLPEKDLVAKFPELKEVIEQGVADWADLDVQHQDKPGPTDI
jgi:hypothetical protein